MRHSRKLASGGMPPRRLVTEGPHRDSAKVERQARIPFIAGPEQAYTTCVRLASFLFRHQRERQVLYSNPAQHGSVYLCFSPARRRSKLGLSCV
jgi:hypothetical protein